MRAEKVRLAELLVSTADVSTLSSADLRVLSRYETRLIRRQDAMLGQLRQMAAGAAGRSGRGQTAPGAGGLVAATGRNAPGRAAAPRPAAGTGRARPTAGSRLAAQAMRLQREMSTILSNQAKIEVAVAQIVATGGLSPKALAALAQVQAQEVSVAREVRRVAAVVPAAGSSTGRSPATASR